MVLRNNQDEANVSLQRKRLGPFRMKKEENVEERASFDAMGHRTKLLHLP